MSTLVTGHSPRQNYFLAALPEADYTRIQPSLELVPLPVGWAVYEAGGKSSYVYFPTTSIVSLLYITENGGSVEIAITGNDGLVGVSLFMGGETTLTCGMVQSGGHGYRLRASILKKEFDRGGPLHNLALRYTQALITQMAQTAVCNRYHSLPQQLCRRLLLSMDRMSSNQFTMTQGLIGNMLGVRRSSVTEAAGKLQAEGLIIYHRGHIFVPDRHKLEARVCECYRVVKTESERLLPELSRLQTGSVPLGASLCKSKST